MASREILKDLYKDYFKVGVACEHINGRFTNHEIGNPDKEKLMVEQFSSMTFANELKPAYNMGVKSLERREDYLPFEINPYAVKMLDFAREHGMKVRGHVMVWHSQCANEAFCVGYEPVTFPTDPELLKEKPFLKHFEKLNPVCYVSRETMLKRLESYINNLLEYMYKNNYADVIYAWDVVNEAIELEDKQETGLRNSYWYQVIGDDFIYWAFKYAHDAVERLAKEYASQYGIDSTDENALKTIKPSLFYNDYNEFMPAKRDAIIAALKREGHGHGSIISEGLIDGIGMQGHLSDNSNLAEYEEALMMYSELVDEVQVTELDVKCTCTNINAEYYQAVFYKELFDMFVRCNKAGAKLTSVTLWGLTDDNSWIRDANPLLFRGDLSTKRSFDALVYVIKGGTLGEPEVIKLNLSDRNIDFEGENYDLAAAGVKMRGFGRMEITDKTSHSGSHSLSQEARFDGWSQMAVDVSDFIGLTIKFSAWVKCPAEYITLNATEGEPLIIKVPGSEDWTLVETTYRVPDKVHSMFITFGSIEKEPDKYSPIFVDDIKISLVGLQEGFEAEHNIALIRGVGHLPVLSTTAKESRTPNGKSLLVTRHEKDATVKFSVASFAGNKIKVRAYVKTEDSVIKMGLDTTSSVELTCIDNIKGEWNFLETETYIPADVNSAEIYISTNGNADYYIDDVLVTMA